MLFRSIKALEQQREAARRADMEKDLSLRFIKSQLEEWRYNFDEAVHHKDEAAMQHWAQLIEAGEKEKAERLQIYQASQQGIAAIDDQIKAKEGELLAAQEAVNTLAAKRDDLQGKLENVALGYFPGPKETFPFFGLGWQAKIPKIQQIVLDDFDRNNFNEAISRVDHCASCHFGIDKVGYESQENPSKTHPLRDRYLANSHPIDKFGCTSCHNGDGTAISSVRSAHASWVDEHGEVHAQHLREDKELFRGPKMQTNCIKCHANVQDLPGAETVARGEKLFIDLGCVGCHLSDGYDLLSKEDGVSIVGPSLRRISAKVDHGWLVRWITNPHEFRPRTRMPNFMFAQEGRPEIGRASCRERV